MRKPEFKPPKLKPSARRLAIEVELLTPQLGGGHIAMQVDPAGWVRPASVRGALRFWWRATAGAGFSSDAAMRKAEADIFGMTKVKLPDGKEGSVAGKLRLAVFCKSSVTADKQPPSDQRDALSTAYFAATMQDHEVKLLAATGNLRPRAEIVLSADAERPLTDKQWAQVLLALQCFVVLGGSGSRTRRGAGAIGVANVHEAEKAGIPRDYSELRSWLKSLYDGKFAREATHFVLNQPEGMFVTELSESAERVQRDVLSAWKLYRQKKLPGTTRTAWPEAPSIVQIRQRLGATGTAPRAHFGLPLNLQNLKGCRPDKAELVASASVGGNAPRIAKRYSSPVWIAIHRVFDQSQPRYVGILIVTPSVLPTGTEIGTLEKGVFGEKLKLPAWGGVADGLFVHLRSTSSLKHVDR